MCVYRGNDGADDGHRHLLQTKCFIHVFNLCMCVLLSLLVHVYVDACTSESLLLDLPWCLTARLGQLTGEPQRFTHFCLLSPNLQAHTTMTSSFTGFWGANSGLCACKANTAVSHLYCSQVTYQCIVNQAALRVNPDLVLEAVSDSGHHRQ